MIFQHGVFFFTWLYILKRWLHYLLKYEQFWLFQHIQILQHVKCQGAALKLFTVSIINLLFSNYWRSKNQTSLYEKIWSAFIGCSTWKKATFCLGHSCICIIALRSNTHFLYACWGLGSHVRRLFVAPAYNTGLSWPLENTAHWV